jgi:hypothetical protein
VYRSRALWIGALSFFFFLAEVLEIGSDLGYAPFYFPPYPSTTIFILYTVFSVFAIVVLFRWLDTTIGVAVELDFFHRDPLHWKAIRKPAWALVLIGAFASQLSPSVLYYDLFGFIFGVPFFYAGYVLIVSQKRIYDDALRKYLRWVGLLVVSLIGEFVTSTINPYLNFPLIITAYCFYRAVGALQKTGRIEEVVAFPARERQSQVPSS